VEFVLTMAEDYGLGKVTGEAVDLSDDNVNALADAIDSEMESTTEALKRSLCVGIYGNGGGSLGRRSSLSTNTITLTNPGDCVNFEVGMVLKASSADGTSGAVRAGSATVTNVNPSGGTVTVDSAAGITGFADNDYLFVEGDFGLKIKGLGAWIPTSAPSSTAFFGVDRTVHIQRLAGHRYDGSGAPVRETIRKALVECARFSGFPDSVFLNPTEHFKLCEELEGKVVYERSSNPSTPDVGFDGAVILSPSGSKVKVYSDPSMLPASSHSSVSLLALSVPRRIYSFCTSEISSSPRALGLRVRMISNTPGVSISTPMDTQLVGGSLGFSTILSTFSPSNTATPDFCASSRVPS
jgi:hypothetical protein